MIEGPMRQYHDLPRCDAAREAIPRQPRKLHLHLITPAQYRCLHIAAAVDQSHLVDEQIILMHPLWLIKKGLRSNGHDILVSTIAQK